MYRMLGLCPASGSVDGFAGCGCAKALAKQIPDIPNAPMMAPATPCRLVFRPILSPPHSLPSQAPPQGENRCRLPQADATLPLAVVSVPSPPTRAAASCPRPAPAGACTSPPAALASSVARRGTPTNAAPDTSPAARLQTRAALLR